MKCIRNKINKAVGCHVWLLLAGQTRDIKAAVCNYTVAMATKSSAQPLQHQTPTVTYY